MQKVTLIIFVFLCFSCGKSVEEVKDTNIDFSYTVDTVMVDSGDGIIYLKRGLNTAALSPDKKMLFNFNPDIPEFEVIDLENLMLDQRIKMEKEGPLGTGDPRSILISTDGKIFFTSFVDVREFNAQLDSMKIYSIPKEKFKGLDADESLDADFHVTTDGKFLFVPYGPGDFQKARKGFAIIELSRMDIKKVPLDLFERSNEYVRTWIENGNIQSQSRETLSYYQLKDKLIISSHNFNEAFLYDLTTDSLTHKVFTSKLTPNAKKVSERNTGNSFEEMMEITEEAHKQVEFGNFLYDGKSDKLFRFTTDLDRMIGDTATFKNVITIFDSDLNQLHEEVVDFNRPNFSFFKDGKLWSYVNVEDELGFAVFTFNF
ncbi:DUF4221 family protein [uncultured Algoriphagus sp.]|uniref:DUF4221 family protein n=1 Tax=uncultured Algoriphagus sp. TaxID=417365 RepID=UPI0030EC2A17|tara:strand:- start:23726 stop:24844 length:1119 start_codon:yes stop_codon:yes gene_type:complete